MRDMNRQTENKIILIHRRTRLAELVARFNTLDQARFYVEHLGSDFSEYLIEDDNYNQSLTEVRGQLENLGRVQPLERAFLPNFIFGPDDVIVVVGQDGLVANTLKYLNSQPVVAINPDPGRWDGVLLPFKKGEAGAIVSDVFKNRRRHKDISLAEAELTDGQRLYAVNDLFIGPRSHVSARYILQSGKELEVQSSSGLIVSTGLGSTGWLKSILAGADGIMKAASALTGNEKAQENKKSLSKLDGSFSWSADYLCYSVREPFPSRTTGSSLVFGLVDEDRPLTVTSQMPSGGIIFSDGIEDDFLEFNSGQKARISVAEKKGRLII